MIDSKTLNLQLISGTPWEGPELKTWLQATLADWDIQVMPATAAATGQTPTLVFYPSLQTHLSQAGHTGESSVAIADQWRSAMEQIIAMAAKFPAGQPCLLISAEAPETRPEETAKAISEALSVTVDLPSLASPAAPHPFAVAIAALLQDRDDKISALEKELAARGTSTPAVQGWNTLWDDAQAFDLFSKALEAEGALRQQRHWHEQLRQSLWRAEQRNAQAQTELQQLKTQPASTIMPPRAANDTTTIAHLEHEIAARDAHIEALLASTSWRLTRPIRGLRHILNRIKR